MIAVYSLLHMFVDGVCAFAMFGTFLPREHGYFYVLLYNFCAFALQMPFGVLSDLLNAKAERKKMDISWIFAASGIFFTFVGAFTHPVILGTGNALFHVGGGVGTIREDAARHYQGRGLGIFVAPGALGLYLGTVAVQNGVKRSYIWAAAVLVFLLCIPWICQKRRSFLGRSEKTAEWTESYQMQQKAVFLAACCFFVVMLRSYVGMAVTFPWKTGALSFVAVLAVVCGKIAGGFCAARYGPLKTVTITLMLSAFCYLYPAAVPAGVCALFFFQMTMPVTLYLMIRRFSSMPGFSFGCLTFALFLGFLPGYFDWKASVGGNVIGCVGSLLSLLVLASYLYIERNRI